MKRLQSFLTLLVLLLVTVGTTWAATLKVGPGKPYTTIQAAVTAASGGDIIEVYAKASPYYTENVDIPGGKNGLIIMAAEAGVILDGTSVGNPKVAFRVASDNVTIQGFTIQNYFYTGATNVALYQPQRGIGIEAVDASSQHNFKNNTITNCNWGIYVHEGNNITVQNNYIYDIRSTSFVGSWNQMGGAGIAFLSHGVALDGNKIKSNTLDFDFTSPNPAIYGIVYGRSSGGNTGADFVEITGNTVIDGDNGSNTFFAYGILNIKKGESINFSNNTSDDCNSALDIAASTVDDNDDVTITNNRFMHTNTTIEVRAQANYKGTSLWEIMITGNNKFNTMDLLGGTDLSNAIASLHYSNDEVTADGLVPSYRYIRNDLDAAITDAENYSSAAMANGRVYVTDGTYIVPATAVLLSSKPMKIQGESEDAILQSSAAILLDIQSAEVEVDPLTFVADVSGAGVKTLINTTGANTYIHHVYFESTGSTGSYNGVVVNDGADEFWFKNNEMIGRINYGIHIETDNAIADPAVIECNTFTGGGIASSSAIVIANIGVANNINYINVISNTIAGDFALPVVVDYSAASGGANINIGMASKGNIFTTTNASANAITITQTANNQVNVNYNNIASNYALMLNNLSTAWNINAGFNLWNVSNTPSYPANIAAKLGTGLAPYHNISILPIYTSAADSASCGFQPLLTSLWTPVYTAEDLNDPITDPANEFFLTIEAALNDGNTTTGDNDFVYLYLNGAYPAETNALDFNSADITVAAAPAQPANVNTRPSPIVSSTFGGVMFEVDQNNITFDKIQFTSSLVNTAYYPIYVDAAATQGLTVTYCKFDVSNSNHPNAAIMFSNAVNYDNVIINNNEFTVANNNYGIDFGNNTFDYDNVEIDGNKFFCSDATTKSIRFNNVDNLDVTDNEFAAGIVFIGDGGSILADNINIYGNKFVSTVLISGQEAIVFEPGAGNVINYVNIEQNKFEAFEEAIVVIATLSAEVNDFDFWTINENYFYEIGVNGITLSNILFGGKLNATNNFWQSNYGPQARAIAPALHEDFTNPYPANLIIANAYGYLHNQATGSFVSLDDATYINFVPWWQNATGNPSTYVGTSFSPIENDVLAPNTGYYASLIFAIDDSPTGSDIYMQDVPDWANAGQTVPYVEQNTIVNSDKSFNVWGQPFYPPTTKIATTFNGVAPDEMFYITNPVAGTFNINFIELAYLGTDDIAIGMNYGLNSNGTIDWCYINDLRAASGTLAFGVLLNDNTNQVSITNSQIENLDGPVQVFGAAAYAGASLTVDNTYFYGRNNANTAIAYEAGILIYGESNLTLTNSFLYDYEGNSGDGFGLLANNIGPNPVGIIEIYQNIFEGNEVGLQFGENLSGSEDYSNVDLYNNIIRNNTTGLIHEPGFAGSVLTAENNYWGSDFGPISASQAGDTQHNTYNVGLQGNAVVDGNANSTIDYIPWRRAASDDLATKIAGYRFAPIVRTNAANLTMPNGLYANFNDAFADLGLNQKLYAYSENIDALTAYSTYTENIVFAGGVIANNQVIGKLEPNNSQYSPGWIIAPNSPIFANAWTSTNDDLLANKGAHINSPKITASAGTLVTDGGAAYVGLSFKGFTFITTGAATKAIELGVQSSNIVISYNTFLADAGDVAITYGSGDHDNWDITNNKYTGSAAGQFVHIEASQDVTNNTIQGNLLAGGSIYMDINGAGTIVNMDILGNQFSSTTGAIFLEGNGAGQLENLNITNNRFASTNTYAFLIGATTDNLIVNTSWTTDVEFTNNYIDYANTTQIMVGFENANPLVQYSTEITATCNWWNGVNVPSTGPTFALNPGGDGARVSEGVFFAPWLAGSTSSTLFAFTPSAACTEGDRVWVNTDGVVTNRTLVFPSLQWAVQHATVVAGTNEHIFVDSVYATNVVENITLNLGTFDYYLNNSDTDGNEPLIINGTFAFSGTNAYDLNLGDDLRIKNTITVDNVGALGQFILGDKNLIAEANITDAGYGAVVTNGTGYLVKENVVTGGINIFPVSNTEAGIYTPARFTATASGVTGGILKVRVNNVSPVVEKGMGEPDYDLHNLWVIDWNKGTSTATDEDFAVTFRSSAFPGAPFVNTTSYAAYWDMDPVAPQWTTKKSISSWNGSNAVQVTGLDLDESRTDWAVFSGTTSFALSDAPTQAKFIQWIGGNDRKLQFKWQRNGVDNQYYAIMGIEGTMTAEPTPAFTSTGLTTPLATCDVVSTNDPWTCQAGDRNFSDGHVVIANPAGSAFWTSSVYHDGSVLPANVKVLKVGEYGGGLTETVTVDSLDQGTYYTFFVANFNYGDGSTAVNDLVSGADGMANYELEAETLNPRTRKTQPAVYMTLDVSNAFATNAANQPNIVYGTTLPSVTDSTDMLIPTNYWSVNGSRGMNYFPVKNQYNYDNLTGGNYAQFCTPTVFPANNVLLYFKGYGNNGGTNWGIKYSENNSTITFTTPLVNSNTSRSRSVETKYYLVSAYDGDGKVAALYDNNKDLQLIFDDETALTTGITGAHPTCAGNSVTFTSGPNSVPNAYFDGWEVATSIGGPYSDVLQGTNVTSTITESNNLVFNTLDYADNGKFFRARYVSTSVCSYPNLGAFVYTTPTKLEIYDPTLLGTQPAVAGDDTPYLCSEGLTSVTFTTSENASVVTPKNMKLKGWYIYDGSTWSSLITGATSHGAATVTSVTGINGTSGTIVFNNADMKLLDGYQVRAEWENGDCAVTQTAVSTLNIVNTPNINVVNTPAGKCIDETITIASSTSLAPNTGATQTIQWQYKTTLAGSWMNVTNGTTADVTISGATTATLSITPHNLNWDGYYFKVIYTHSEGGTNCTDESNTVQIDVLPTPDFVEIPNQTVCQNSTFSITAQDVVPSTWSGNNLTWWTNSTPDLTGTPVAIGASVNGTNVTFSGALNQTITFNNIQPNAGWATTYIIVKDVNSCTGFEAFKVTVDEQPIITSATITPANPTEVCAGGNVVYTITYTPTSTNDVKWYYNNVLVAGAGASVTLNASNTATIVTGSGTSTLTLANVSAAIHGVDVYAVVDNGTCNVAQSADLNAVIETIPVAPTTIGAQNIFARRFDINWTAVANADKYDIEVSADPLFAPANIVASAYNVAAPAISWTGMANCALDPAKTYYFRVSAENQCGNSPWNTSNVLTLDPTVTSIAWQSPDNGAFGNVLSGSQSVAQQVQITYYQLDAGLALDVPAQYEIYVDGSWQTGSVDLTNDLTLYLGTPGLPITTTFDVRFSPTSCGLKTGDLTLTTLETCTGVTDMPTPDFLSVSGTGVVAAPTVNASNGIAMESTANELTLTWTNGGGNSRLVILSTTPTLSAGPLNNTTYTVGQTIGGGTILGVTPTQPLVVSGLTAGINYYIHVWEYNECNPGTEQYDTDSYMFQPYYVRFGTTIPDQLSGTESGDVELFLADRAGTELLTNPMGEDVTVIITNSEGDVNPNFVTSPSPVVIPSSATSTLFKFTWTNACGVLGGNLIANAIAEDVNGINTGNVTNSNTFDLNVSQPTNQARIIIWVGVPCEALTSFKWTNGNGAGRLVVAREGALPVAPADYEVYTTNSDWDARGAANEIGAPSDATYAMGVVFNTDSPNNQIDITNLEQGKTFYFRVFEFNGCIPELRDYLLTNASFNPRSRTINCKEGNNLSDIVVDRFNAVSNSGKGIINFNTLYEANISGFELRRINVTDEEMNGILVGSYMNNPELVAAGNTMTGKSYNFNDNSSLLEVGKTYLYQLTAIAFDGTRIDVAETELTINDDIHTGISEFSVSPVTVTNNEVRFDLTVNKSQNVTITMYDVTGQKVASIANDTRINRGTQQFTSSIQNVTNGTYMIVVEGADGVSSLQKFQIVR